MKARLTHLAVLTALVLPMFIGKVHWVGFSDGAW